MNVKVKENENDKVNVSMNLFEVLFGPPRTGGRLESRLYKPRGNNSTLGTYRNCGVVSRWGIHRKYGVVV